jgi:hypothetical protein
MITSFVNITLDDLHFIECMYMFFYTKNIYYTSTLSLFFGYLLIDLKSVYVITIPKYDFL